MSKGSLLKQNELWKRLYDRTKQETLSFEKIRKTLNPLKLGP